MKILFDYHFIYRNLDLLLLGLFKTLQVSILSIFIALCLGLVLAILKMSKHDWLSLPAKAIIEFVRNTPLLIQLYIIFFGFFTIGLKFSAFTCGVFGLGLHYTTYLAEIYRAGIESISKTQREAAEALGFRHFQVMRLVILPQAIYNIIPPAFNEFIAMIQGSTLVSAIGVVELTLRASLLVERSAAVYEVFFSIGALYLLLNSILTTASRILERRLTAFR